MHLFSMVALQRDVINTIKLTAVLNISKAGQAWIKRAFLFFQEAHLLMMTTIIRR